MRRKALFKIKCVHCPTYFFPKSFTHKYCVECAKKAGKKSYAEVYNTKAKRQRRTEYMREYMRGVKT